MNIKFQFVGEIYSKEYATVRRGFFFVFSGAIFGIRWFESFCRLNGSMEIRKKLGAKKAEKSLEISAFLPCGVPQGGFHRSNLNRPKDLAHPYKIDPYRKFFRNRSVCFGRWVDLPLGDDGSCM